MTDYDISDTDRLELVEEYLDDFYFAGPTSTVVLDWFAGDGGGHVVTRGGTFREAIDAAFEQFGPTPEMAARQLARETLEKFYAGGPETVTLSPVDMVDPLPGTEAQQNER